MRLIYTIIPMREREREREREGTEAMEASLIVKVEENISVKGKPIYERLRLTT